MDTLTILKMIDGRERNMYQGSTTFTISQLGWSITVGNIDLTDDIDQVLFHLVQQIENRLLVLKAFPCEAVDAPEVAIDEEPEWDNELVPEIWNW